MGNFANQLAIAAVSCILIIAMLCGGCGLGLSLFATRPSANVVKKQEKPKPTRKELCERAAKAKFHSDLANALNTRTTAKFSLDAGYYEKDGREAVLVFGEVTAQNTFGAMITEKVSALYVIIGDAIMLAEYQVGSKQKIVSSQLYQEAADICGLTKTQ